MSGSRPGEGRGEEGCAGQLRAREPESWGRSAPVRRCSPPEPAEPGAQACRGGMQLTGLPSTPASSQQQRRERKPGWHACAAAGLPGDRPLTRRSASDPGARCPIGFYWALGVIFSQRHMSKSSSLKPSQSETVCFNSQKPLGFMLFCLHLSSETPETQINQQTTFFFFSSFQMKTLSFLFLLSCSISLQICRCHTHLGSIPSNPVHTGHRFLQWAKEPAGQPMLYLPHPSSVTGCAANQPSQSFAVSHHEGFM